MISDCVSLSDKLRREDASLVSKDGTVDALLSAVVDELAPDEKSVGISGSQYDCFAGADELAALTEKLARLNQIAQMRAQITALEEQLTRPTEDVDTVDADSKPVKR